MKLTIKFAAILCLQFLAMTTFAQSGKKAFTGIWELAQAASNGQDLQKTGPGYLKIFNADGTFANVQVRNTGSVISHSGEYTINDAEHYTEKALYRMPEMTGGPLGTDFKLHYEFSEDKKQLTLTFILESGLRITEVWQKL